LDLLLPLVLTPMYFYHCNFLTQSSKATMPLAHGATMDNQSINRMSFETS